MGTGLSNAANSIAAERHEQLNVLARRANEAHHQARAAAATAVERALEAGRALLAARELCPHGSWLPWLNEHFEGAPQTARRYMKAAKLWASLALQASDAAQLPLRHVTQLLSNLIPQGSGATDSQKVDGQGDTVAAAVSDVPAADTAAVAKRRVSTGPAHDWESVRMVVDLFNRLVDTLRHVVHAGTFDTASCRLVLDSLERLRPNIDDFEDALRFVPRQR